MNKKEAILAMLDGKVVLSPAGVGAKLVGHKLHNLTMVFDGEDFVYTNSQLVRFRLHQDEGWEIYQEPKVKTKFYQFATDKGTPTDHYYTEDLFLWWNGKAAIESVREKGNWIRTNNYIEVEI